MSVVIGLDGSSRKLALITLSYPGAIPVGALSPGPDAMVVEAGKKESDRAKILNYLDVHITRVFTDIAEESHGQEVFLFIEQPVVGKGGSHSTIVQAQSQGVAMAAAMRSGITSVYPVNNKTWKRDVVGNGNASKDDARTWLEQNRPRVFRLCGNDQDLVDAGCIAEYGTWVLSRATTLPGQPA